MMVTTATLVTIVCIMHHVFYYSLRGRTASPVAQERYIR
jgi:hypothetical protein